MAALELPSKEFLDQLLKYDPATGKLFWKPRSADMFSADGRDPDWKAANWNSKYAGKEAFAIRSPNGYLAGLLSKRKLYAHRLIWRMAYDVTPGEIDHIDGDRTNNRLSNLRAVDRTANNRNKRLRKRSNSGHVGVCWHRAAGKWAASISVKNRTEYLGLFENLEDAVAARKARERHYGFTERHGYGDAISEGLGDSCQR